MALADNDNELDTPPVGEVVVESAPATATDRTGLEDSSGVVGEASGQIDINTGSQDVLLLSSISQSQEQTRAKIALWFTYVFLFLVSLSVLLPFALHMTRNDLFPQPIEAVKELTTTIASILAGPFGFIVGFYFKKGSD